MANGGYNAGKQGILDCTIDVNNDDLEGTLIDADDHTKNYTTDEDYADVTAAAKVAVTGALTITSTAAGVYDADNATFPLVTGDECEEVLLRQNTGVDSSSLLILSWDTFTSGMPVTPNGGNIDLTFSGSGVFEV